MKKEVLQDEMLRRYLLDDVTDAERQEIELRFFEDDAVFDEMLAFEDELFYDYKQNRLPPKERNAFEQKFLNSPEDRARADFAEAFLQQTAALSKPDPGVERKLVEAEKPSLWQVIAAFFESTFPAVRFGLAAAAVLLLVGVVALYIQNSRLQNEMADLQNKRNADQAAQERIVLENERRQAELERLFNEQKASGEQNEKRLQEIEAERARLEREIAEARRRLNEIPKTQPAPPRNQPPTAQPARSVVALVLSPLTRSTDGLARAELAPGTKNLQLRLMLKNTADYQTLRATLKTVDDGATVWSSPRLQAKGTGAQKSLTLNIPAQQLKRGDYEVLLSGTTASGADEEITSYYFSVVK